MENRKNVLLIGMDDAFSYWRFKHVFGAELKTPNLDRICDVSSAFTAAYCQIPVCGPSRSSAMSGLSPYETGIFDNYSSIFEVLRPEQMWQYRLKQEGYYCSTAGKIHHGYKPLPPAVHNTLYSHPARPVHFGPKRDAPHKKVGGRTGGAGTTDPADDKLYYDYRSSQDAIRFLSSWKAEDGPFYREVGFHHPHPPFRTPMRFKDMYDIKDFIRPEDWKLGYDLSDFTGTFMQENMETDEAVEYWQQSVRNYFSALSHVDHHIGRVWDALQASLHAKNTIVVVFSDHGYHMGDKNRFRKFTLWEEATRVPFIVHDPDSPAQMIDDPVSLTDMGPTILDYSGARPMQHSVGRSLRKLVEGEPYYNRAVPTFWYGSASVRYGDYRVTLYQDGSSEFHNVKTDPWLTQNVADTDPAYAEHRAALLQTCKDYGVFMATQNDPVTEAAHFASLIDGAETPDSLPADGIISVGDIKPGHDTPGYRKHFATLKEDGTLKISDAVRELLFASDSNGGVSHFRVHCNDLGSRIYFFAGHKRFLLEVTGGAGFDRIITQNDDLIAHLGAGESLVQAGASDSQIYASTGRDTVHLVAGSNLIHGGSGNTVIYGGIGNDTIHSGQGANIIDTGRGDNRVVIEGGTNTVFLGAGTNTLVLQRTGLPQLIEGFTNDVLDISDWNNIDQLIVRKDGTDSVVTCGQEQVIFRGTTKKIVTAALRMAQ